MNTFLREFEVSQCISVMKGEKNNEGKMLKKFFFNGEYLNERRNVTLYISVSHRIFGNEAFGYS